jgi:hypothetical protein
MRQRTTRSLYDQSFSVGKNSKNVLTFGFQAKDTAQGWFAVSDTLRIDFFVLDTQNFSNPVRDSAHSRICALNAMRDSFLLGLPVKDSFFLEFSNHDTSSGRTVRLHLNRIFWQDAP